MNGLAVMENVRRYRAIASLYRQTAVFRPLQSRSLMEQAMQWEHRAVRELEAYFEGADRFRPATRANACADARWAMIAA